mgnify:CR=1 FL=1
MEYFDIKLLIQASGSPLFTQTYPLVNPFILRNHRQKKLSIVHYTGVNPVKMGQHSDACLNRITRNYSTKYGWMLCASRLKTAMERLDFE